MQIDIKRRWETNRSVCGELWIDGILNCYTLEPARNTPVHPGHPCIPAGAYKVILTMSPHFGFITPEVLNVPGRTAIRWHPGNKPEDVLGCVAVGNGHDTDWVSDSKTAFDQLMEYLRGADSITATYIEAIQ